MVFLVDRAACAVTARAPPAARCRGRLQRLPTVSVAHAAFARPAERDATRTRGSSRQPRPPGAGTSQADDAACALTRFFAPQPWNSCADCAKTLVFLRTDLC